MTSLQWEVNTVRIEDEGRNIVVADERAKPRRYDVGDEKAEEILSEISALDVGDREKILGFVQKRGFLGLSRDEIPSYLAPGFPNRERMIRTKFNAVLSESLSATKEALRRLQEFMERLRSVHEKWTSRDPHLPLPKVTPQERRLVDDLHRTLFRYRLRQGLRIDHGKIEETLEAQSLHGALYLVLGRLVTTKSAKDLRRCKGCEGLFIAPRSKHNREYCGGKCRNKRNARIFYYGKEHKNILKAKRKARRKAKKAASVEEVWRV
jgi:hypothetical protein